MLRRTEIVYCDFLAQAEIIAKKNNGSINIVKYADGRSCQLLVLYERKKWQKN